MKTGNARRAALGPLLIVLLLLVNVAGCQSQKDRLRGIPNTCELCR